MKNKASAVLAIVFVLASCAIAAGSNTDSGTPSGEYSTDSVTLLTAFPAPVERTGQTASYGARDDGKLRKGVAWPKPRFKNNGDGTVTDKLTGLIWLRDANCSVFFAGDATGHNWRTWENALYSTSKLKNGSCGLKDLSAAGNWRLPNIKEMQSLIAFAFEDPAVANSLGTAKWTEGNPFQKVSSGCYWSSTTHAGVLKNAHAQCMRDGYVCYAPKTDLYMVWPVRGGN